MWRRTRALGNWAPQSAWRSRSCGATTQLQSLLLRRRRRRRFGLILIFGIRVRNDGVFWLPKRVVRTRRARADAKETMRGGRSGRRNHRDALRRLLRRVAADRTRRASVGETRVLVFGLRTERAAATQVFSGDRCEWNGKGCWRQKRKRNGLRLIHRFHEAEERLERGARLRRLLVRVCAGNQVDRLVWRLVWRVRRRLVRGGFGV